MKNSISLDQLLASFYKFIHRYHVVVFVILVIGGMIIVMFMLNNTIQSSTDADLIDVGQPQAKFDQETIKQLESLKMDSDNTDDLRFPSGRINPFVE